MASLAAMSGWDWQVLAVEPTNEATTGAGDLTLSHLALACLVIVGQSLAARVLELGLSNQLLVSGTRAFIQLSCLGLILYPIFATQHPTLVFGYIFGFMILVSTHEACARPKVTYPGMFWHSFLSLGSSLFIMGIVLMLIVEPVPWYNPVYLIPLSGMLINNALSGTALALNGMLDFLVNGRDEVEVMLAFGATPWEAAWPGFVRSFQAALIPTINGMNVLGLVAIPGMMTGQILGGASPMKAARYQIVISFLISGCSFCSVCMTNLLAIMSFFDNRGRHDTAQVKPQTRMKIDKWFDPKSWKKAPAKSAGKPGASEPLLDGAGGEAGDPLASTRPLELRREALPASGGGTPVLEIDIDGLVAETRNLAIKMTVGPGEVACIMGPSGVGKSTLLRWISDLRTRGGTKDGSRLSFKGVEAFATSATAWRRQVVYVMQSKAPLPGTPQDLLQAIQKLRAHQQTRFLDIVPVITAVGLSEVLLERPWADLSGGESQRMMLCIALWTRPSVLLLDEPTSALDEASKLLVESAIKDFSRQGQSEGRCVLMVTHDLQQASRVGHSVWQVQER